MVVPVLCLVCLFFVGWILVLKMEIDGLKKELDRIKLLLKTKLGYVGKEVEIKQGLALNKRS